MTSTPSRFIALEGGEGAGKSTQARRLTEALRAAGHTAVLTREPGGTAGGEKIRELLVNGTAKDWSPLAEALLMNAARAEHLEKVIRPALQSGKWVICDRFADSTMAYQGYGQGADKMQLQRLREMVVADTEPGLTIIFDLPVETGLARVTNAQRYEKMGRAFHENLRSAFLNIAKADGAFRRVIDASGSEGEVWQRIVQVVSDRFGVSL